MISDPQFFESNEISYQGSNGTKIKMIIDDLKDTLTTIKDSFGNIIGEHFHKSGSGQLTYVDIYPIVSGTYKLTAYTEEVSLHNKSNEIESDELNIFNLKQITSFDQISDTKSNTILDLNFWFRYGSKEINKQNNFMSELTSSLSGFNFWDDYEEDNFLPYIFSKNNIFKLLYSDMIDSSFNIIDHKLKKLSKEDFGKLPEALKFILDSYQFANDLWVTTSDTYDILDSILVSEVDELMLLEILRDAKKFTNDTDSSIIELPLPIDDFVEDFYNDFESKTNLTKCIILELYYLHYNLDDNFDLYRAMLNEMVNFQNSNLNKSYNLMCSLYCYLTLNKVFNKKILNTGLYTPDYWSNDQ